MGNSENRGTTPAHESTECPLFKEPHLYGVQFRVPRNGNRFQVVFQNGFQHPRPSHEA